MPDVIEILTLLVAILAIGILLKVARLAIRLILFVITLAIVAAIVWLVFF